jgi:hypothetical protein
MKVERELSGRSVNSRVERELSAPPGGVERERATMTMTIIEALSVYGRVRNGADDLAWTLPWRRRRRNRFGSRLHDSSGRSPWSTATPRS